jgi:hypothetical protein
MRWLLTAGMILYLVQANAQTPPVDEQSDKATNFSDVAGSPYLFRDWSDGLVRFSSGRLMKQFKLKFDCAQNRLMLQYNGSTFGAESKISEFVIFQRNGKKTDSLLFRKGFPKYGRATEETFYQVLTDGPVMLLHLFSKNILEEKQFGATSLNRRYQDEDKLFLLRDNQMVEISRDRNALIELLADQSAALKSFIESNDLKMKSTSDIAKVIQKYNQLVQ